MFPAKYYRVESKSETVMKDETNSQTVSKQIHNFLPHREKTGATHDDQQEKVGKADR